MKNRNLKISSNIWQQTPPEFFLSNQVTRVRQPMVFQTKDSNHSKIKYTSICHLCHTSFINSETTALLHLTSFTEGVRFQLPQTTIAHRTFETNSSFQVEQRTTRRLYFLFFKSFLLALTKLSFWGGDWALSYHSLKFRQFPDIFYVLRRSATREATRIYHVYN